MQESCGKVTKSVEDAKIKTSMLEENSALLEEKLHNLQHQVQVEDFRWSSQTWMDSWKTYPGILETLKNIEASDRPPSYCARDVPVTAL
ncbi:testis-specific serine kinase substrate [Crotalus adamanteus]|uniref:Testis-specific serine kinase substrate n=1 Tax=Crotalus adamanteus TaxID=8729 RepID=A0AAW1B573_CROAD